MKKVDDFFGIPVYTDEDVLDPKKLIMCSAIQRSINIEKDKIVVTHKLISPEEFYLEEEK